MVLNPIFQEMIQRKRLRPFLIPMDSKKTCALTGVTVAGTVSEVCSTLIITQSYENKNDTALDVSFIFPLPETGHVTSVEAKIQDTVRRLVLKPKETAQAEYTAAVEAGHSAALMQRGQNSNTYKLDLGRIDPNETCEVTITVVVDMQTQGTAAVLEIPTSMIPPYTPEAPHQDHPTFSPGSILAYKLDRLDLHVHGTRNVASVDVNAARFDVQLADGDATISLRNPVGFKDTLSLPIYFADWEQPRVAVDGSSLLTTGAVAVSVRPAWTEEQIDGLGEATEIWMVVDRSGSMRGTAMRKAKDTLALCLNSLPFGVQFNIMSFGSRHQAWQPHSQTLTQQTLMSALQSVSQMSADMGGTNVLRPLTAIFGQAPPAGYQRQIFFFSDGGVSNTDQVIRLCNSHVTNTKIYSFGLGSGASRALVDGVAAASGGRAVFIGDSEEVNAPVLRQINRSLRPAITDLEATFWTRSDAMNMNDPVPGYQPFPAILVPSRVPSVLQGDNISIIAIRPPLQGEERVAMLPFISACAKKELDARSRRLLVSGAVAEAGQAVADRVAAAPAGGVVAGLSVPDLVIVKGKRGAETISFRVEVEAGEVRTTEGLRVLAAGRLLREVEIGVSHLSEGVPDDQLKAAQVALSLSQQVLCQHTALVSVHTRPGAEPVRREVQTVALPGARPTRRHAPRMCARRSGGTWNKMSTSSIARSTEVRCLSAAMDTSMFSQHSRKRKAKKAKKAEVATLMREAAPEMGMCFPPPVMCEAPVMQAAPPVMHEIRESLPSRPSHRSKPMSSREKEMMPEGEMEESESSGAAAPASSPFDQKLLMAILGAAAPRGGWDRLPGVLRLDRMPELAALREGVAEDVWATCIVMTVLQKHFARERDLWALMVRKAKKSGRVNDSLVEKMLPLV
eukprot:gnl/Dysnectes_brevis/495_a548_3038.p1 GENE.gnl/Dysnectes_brevis/495_a548_3038~~gnl/Dysnectes_brevis/495_a548_3038.p1  ORF type:complete len:905 (-),score=295.30 gnl/Dysnectes_brevis/495_a548_3038:1680-4394(-)